MGSSSSKPKPNNSEKSAKSSARSESPKEKHNSADSKAPLAEHAATFASPRASSQDCYRSVASNNTAHLGRTSNSEDEIQPTSRDRASRTSSIASPPRPSLSAVIPSITVDDVEGHANVTRPPPPPQLRHLDELIDPAELPIDCHIRSPSGTMLALEQFLVHPDRPRSIRERQEEIKEKVRAASRLGVEPGKGEDEKGGKSGGNVTGAGNKAEKRKKRRCWGLLCFTSS